MTDRILKILDNVRYWETCPEDYKKDIETFLEAQSQALRIHDVVGRSEQLKCVHEPDRLTRKYAKCVKCNMLLQIKP
jgi:hypothetical protein